VEGTVREVKRRVRVVASSSRAIDRSVPRWIVVTIVEWSSEVRWELVTEMMREVGHKDPSSCLCVIQRMFVCVVGCRSVVHRAASDARP